MRTLTGKISAVMVAVCMLCAVGTTYGKETPDMVRKEMKVSESYQLVKVNGNFKVHLIQGDEQKIVVEADETLVPEVKYFIADHTLNIYTSDQVKKRITLWITMKDINNFNKFGSVRVIRE